MTGPRSVPSEPSPLIISFDVLGLPVAKGSMIRYGPGQFVDTNKGLAVWMNQVQAAALRQRVQLGRTMVGPLHCDVTFRLPMPKNRPARARNCGVWASTVKPDADKLLRAVFDSLTRSGLILDDAQISTGRFEKIEVVGWAGCTIDLWEAGR